eukprot:15344284-Ditylum_brightwellii.AAC.1
MDQQNICLFCTYAMISRSNNKGKVMTNLAKTAVSARVNSGQISSDELLYNLSYFSEFPPRCGTGARGNDTLQRRLETDGWLRDGEILLHLIKNYYMTRFRGNAMYRLADSTGACMDAMHFLCAPLPLHLQNIMALIRRH